MRLPKSRTVYGSLAAVLVMFGGAATILGSTYKTIAVKDRGQRKVLRGFATGTVADFLKIHHVHVAKRDRVSPALDSPVSNHETVEIVSPKTITVDYEGNVKHAWTFAHTVGQFLKGERISLKPSDRVNVSTKSELSNGEAIEIHSVISKTTTATQEIPFQTIRRSTADLLAGHQRNVTHGVKGLLKIQTTRVYRDGHKIAQHVTKKVVRNPVDAVVEIGTAQPAPEHVLATRGSVPDPGLIKESLTVLATAYVAGGTTATGLPAEPGVIAVDPSVIPLGSRLYIPGIGTVIAADTGGAIQGDHIDICMSSDTAARDWGARTITVYLLG